MATIPNDTVQLFLSRLPQAQRDTVDDPARIGELLAKLWSSSRKQNPHIEVDCDTFVSYLAERLPETGPLESLIGEIHASDLYLACACARGDPDAVALFETRFFGGIHAALIEIRLPPSLIEEVKQTLREQLFVGRQSDGVPMIENYSGRGQLKHWLRIIAVRTAPKVIGQSDKEVPLQDTVIDAVLPSSQDEELKYLKRLYRIEFTNAFQEALASLSTRERNLLRQYHSDRLTVEQLGALYRVHHATAARWLIKARQALLARTREELLTRLKVGESECESIMQLIESQIDLTLRSLPKVR